MSDGRYRLLIVPTVRRQLAEQLPKVVAFAAYEFIAGPLRPPLTGRHSARRGTWRVMYRIDDDHRTVTVVGVFARADAYR